MVLTREATVEEAVQAVDRDGYVIIEGLMDPEWVAAARADLQRVLAETSTGRNSFEGFSTQRVYALFAKTRYFDGPGTHPLVLGVLDHVLGHYQFSAPVGIQIGPGEVAQVLHRDDDVYPLPRTGRDVVVGDQTAASPDTGVGVAARRDRRQADRRVREVVARVVEGREMKGVAVTGADALDDDGPRAVARREHQPPHEGRAERGARSGRAVGTRSVVES